MSLVEKFKTLREEKPKHIPEATFDEYKQEFESPTTVEFQTPEEVQTRFKKAIYKNIGPNKPQKGNWQIDKNDTDKLVYKDAICEINNSPSKQMIYPDIPEDKLVTVDIQEVVDYMTNRNDVRNTVKRINKEQE